MIQVSFLESADTIEPTDWCRLISGPEPYDGYCHDTKWQQVKYVLGKTWYGKTVSEIIRSSLNYEFVRGEVPRSHRATSRGLYDHSKEE
jgi:hypothetical protein